LTLTLIDIYFPSPEDSKHTHTNIDLTAAEYTARRVCRPSASRWTKLTKLTKAFAWGLKM